MLSTESIFVYRCTFEKMPPRSSVRNRTATPARATRAATVATQDTPGTRRSARAASRQPTAIRDSVANPALPEIQLQQSYAYGSSKTPALPEQLHASQIPSMRAVANRLADANAEAEQNFEARAAELKANTPESQTSARDTRAQRRATKEPVRKPPPPSSPTPDSVRKQDRVAAWVDSSQLDSVPEEEPIEEEVVASERDRGGSEPSSFPDGSFDHSYNYERGLRGPDLPLPEPEPDRQRSDRTPVPTQNSVRVTQANAQNTTTPLLSRIRSRTKEACRSIWRFIQDMMSAMRSWLRRMVQMMQKSISELPDAPFTSTLFKTFLLSAVIGIAGISFCTLFTYTCNPGSTSVISQSLQRVCGQCSGSNAAESTGWNLTTADPHDLNALLSALRQTQTHISQVESRLSSRIDSSQASHIAGITALRSHQEVLESQIRRLKAQNAPNQRQSSQAVSSPLIADKINFFSVSSGAAVIPELTSPTRIRGRSFLGKIGQRMLGLHQPAFSPAVTALEPWTDEGDCWCAAANHSLHLGVQLTQQIYPTELIIEHFPSKSSLQPGNAPREIELWADFQGLNAKDWTKLHVEDLISDSGMPPVGTSKVGVQQTWARIGTAMYVIASETAQQSGHAYEMAADDTYGAQSARNMDEDGLDTEVSHVQRFNLQVNQHGLLHHTSRFLLRAVSNHGADHTCLYRVRLHGLPLS